MGCRKPAPGVRSPRKKNYQRAVAGTGARASNQQKKLALAVLERKKARKKEVARAGNVG
jgi:hypothetical protein